MNTTSNAQSAQEQDQQQSKTVVLTYEQFVAGELDKVGLDCKDIEILMPEGKDKLCFSISNHKFYSYEPADLVSITYCEYAGRDEMLHDGDTFYTNHTEYFKANDLVNARLALVTRMTNDPFNISGLSKSLDELVPHSLEWLRQEEQTKAVTASHNLGFRLPTVSYSQPFPARDNVMRHDYAHMQTPLVDGWSVLHPGGHHEDNPKPMTYMILCNSRTGQLIKINLVQPAGYVPRGFSEDEVLAGGSWCVWAEWDDGRVGVLEWCTGEKDAREVLKTACEYTDFIHLKAMKYGQPDSKVSEFTTFKYWEKVEAERHNARGV